MRGISSNGRTALIISGGANDFGGIGFADGTVTYLAPLAGDAAAGAFGIYNGKYVGYSLLSSTLGSAPGSPGPAEASRGTLHATVWNGFTAATVVNFNGIVGGTVFDASRRQRGVIWAAGGTATALGLQSGEANSLVRDINEGGDALGRTSGAAGTLATVWSHGDVDMLSNLAGFSNGNGRGINDRDAAIGFSFSDVDLSTFGMYWSFNGSGYDSYSLDSLVANLGEWRTGAAQSIKHNGTIFGFGTAPMARAARISSPRPRAGELGDDGRGLHGVAAKPRRPCDRDPVAISGLAPYYAGSSSDRRGHNGRNQPPLLGNRRHRRGRMGVRAGAGRGGRRASAAMGA